MKTKQRFNSAQEQFYNIFFYEMINTEIIAFKLKLQWSKPAIDPWLTKVGISKLMEFFYVDLSWHCTFTPKEYEKQ